MPRPAQLTRIVTRALLPALLLVAGQPAAAGNRIEQVPEAVLEAISEHVRSSMERNRTPGVALALTTRDGLAAEATWGHADLKLRRQVTPLHRFQIGSNSERTSNQGR